MSAAPVIETEISSEEVLSVSPQVFVFPSVRRFARFSDKSIELRIELTIGRKGPVIQAWCIGLGPDVHRVCYKVHNVTDYFIEQGVPEELSRPVLEYVSRLYRKEKEYYKGLVWNAVQPIEVTPSSLLG